MKKIAICGYEDKTKNYKAVLEYLGCEVKVSLELEDLKNCEALLLPGGGDINPKYYNEEINGANEPDNNLDEKQFEALSYFEKNNKAIMGICRGLQLTNIYFGGSLVQDLATKDTHKALNEEKNIDNEHQVETVGESFLKDLYGSDFMINSWHHQGIKDLAADFRLILRAADGIVEAIEHTSKKIIAFQFHPERMSLEFKKDNLVDGIKIFEYFINRMV